MLAPGRFLRLLCCALGSQLACGARSAVDAWGDPSDAVFPWESSIASGRTRRPPECVQNWRTLHESRGAFPPALAVAAGEVIYGEPAGPASSPQLRALDPTSAPTPPRLIHTGLSYEDLWLEGDSLLVWTQGQLFSVPLHGGSEQLILDARGPDPSTAVNPMLVERDAFYWTRKSTDAALLEIWRQPREGATASRIASIDDLRFDAQLMAATDEIVIVADGRSGAVVPIEGGPVLALASVEDGQLAGIDKLGAYYSRASNRTRRGGRALEFELRRAPADGSPATRFWGRSAGHQLQRIWPADTGWIATGAYYMFDRTPHGVIAHIDENGDELLIACDRDDNFVISRPVYWDGAFYAVTRASEVWRIVEIRIPE